MKYSPEEETDIAESVAIITFNEKSKQFILRIPKEISDALKLKPKNKAENRDKIMFKVKTYHPAKKKDQEIEIKLIRG